MKYYKLIDYKPVRCSLVEAGLWLTENPRAHILAESGEIVTVFCNICEDKPFETRVRGRCVAQYDSYEEALKGHLSQLK
jgi:hypothetical protein